MPYLIELLSDRISHDKMGFERRIRFCPSCGTQRIERSTRSVDPFGKQISGKEYWCSLCGFGFNLRPSVDWNIALTRFREHRKTGIPDRRFVEAAVDAEVVEAWRKEYEPDKRSRGGVWSLADKLKAALGIRD